MTEPKWQIIPLKGRYCHNCVKSLRDFRLAMFAIVVMCREDQEQFLHNGDVEIVRKLMEEKHESKQPAR
jgi:hypothetical protein